MRSYQKQKQNNFSPLDTSRDGGLVPCDVLTMGA